MIVNHNLPPLAMEALQGGCWYNGSSLDGCDNSDSLASSRSDAHVITLSMSLDLDLYSCNFSHQMPVIVSEFFSFLVYNHHKSHYKEDPCIPVYHSLLIFHRLLRQEQNLFAVIETEQVSVCKQWLALMYYLWWFWVLRMDSFPNLPLYCFVHLFGVGDQLCVKFINLSRILLLTSICFSWFCPVFCFHLLAYCCLFRCLSFEISYTFIYSFGDRYQKMSFVDNCVLWKYCLWLSNISCFIVVARTVLLKFFTWECIAKEN